MLPVVAIMFVLALSSVALASTTFSSQSQVQRDYDEERSIAVAEAGVERAVARQSRVEPDASLPCVWVDASGTLSRVAASADGWCPAVSDTAGQGSFSYRVEVPGELCWPSATAAPCTGSDQKVSYSRVVSTGTVDGETRRVMTAMVSPTGEDPFAGRAVQALDDVLLNSESRVNGDVAANGNITTKSGSRICGNANPGPGKKFKGKQCGGYSKANLGEPLVFAPPDQGDAATNNDNGRFFGQDPKSGQVTWNSTTRQLYMNSESTLTLGGGTYSLCRLTLNSESVLRIAAGSVVTIYFDDPDVCGLDDDDEQLSVNSESKIINMNNNAATLRLYFVGSSSTTTKIKLNSESKIDIPTTIYAPLTDFELNSESKLRGAVVAKSVDLNSESRITYDSAVESLDLNVESLYVRQSFVECQPTTSSSDPADGC